MADRSMVKTAPSGEKGSATGIPMLGLLSWAAMGAMVGNDMEYVPELQWPNSIGTVTKMRNDSQVDGLANGAILPVTRWQFALDPNNAPPEAVRELSRDLGLPIAERNGIGTWEILERPIPRSQGRFNFDEHRREALLAILYGHQYFEQSTDLIPPPPDWSVATPLRARLRKLAVRPPWTLASIDTDPVDGGLQAIKQISTPINDPGITVDRLVAYVWGKEGANWVGRSVLRSCYRPWLVKDRIMRVGAINIERNGAGTPIITAPPGATKAQIRALEDLAVRFRGGESAGGSIPHGAELKLVGVLGSQPDAVGFMRFLNEEMAKAFLQMVKELGQTSTGSRALGETFLSLMDMFLEAIADWFVSIFNAHVIEDWMIWNFGTPDDPNVDQYAPRLIYIKSGSPVEGLGEAIDDGTIEVDEETEEEITGARRQQTSRRRASGGQGHGQGAERRSSAVSATDATSPVSLPARQLRRQPYAHEVAAATDFAALDTAWQSALDLMFMEVRALTHHQVDELHDAIVDADGDLDAIMEIAASPQHGDVIAARLSSVADLAVAEAVAEAGRQGISISAPDTDDLHEQIRSRAYVVDAMITRDVTDAATRRAIRLTGGALAPAGVASQVRNELNAMTWVGVRDQLAGAVTTSQNAGRGLVFRRDGHEGDIYASELLDTNTCSACSAMDGTPYQSMEDAEMDYPTGGYKACEGRERCRGTLVKVYRAQEQAPPTPFQPYEEIL